MSQEDQGVTYGNVGVVDMRAADEAALRRVRRIGNLGMLVHSPDSAALVNLLSVGNIGCTIEAPAHYKLEVAPVRFNAQALRNRSEPVGMIIMAPVAVNSDVSAEDIEQGIERLFIMGPVICPDNVVAALRAKTEQQMGPVTCYPAGARLVSTLGALRLDYDALATLEDGTALNVEGRLTVPEPLPADLLERKIQWLNVDGAVLCHEENAPILRPLMPEGSGRFRLLPAGFKVVERALTIDGTFLRFSATEKLYGTGRITVDSAVTAEEIDRYLKELRCAGMILAPAGLRDSLAPKCDLERDQVFFYEGALWLEEGRTELTAERFAYLNGAATLLVEGVVTIHDAVDPALLMERLAKVHNSGIIRCTPRQMAALQARMDRNEGELVDSTAAEEEESAGVGNIGFLPL